MSHNEKLAYAGSVILFILAMVIWMIPGYGFAPIFGVLSLVVLAFAFSFRKKTKRFSFTLLILAAVCLAMFYPQLFRSVGDFDLKKLIVPILMVIMFGMGTSMSVRDFIGVIKMPKGVLIGLICQFSIMPFVGFGLAKISGFPPEIAAGIILIGCSPSGLASNVMSYIAKANLALSLTLTMVATLLAPLFTPFLMKMLADQLVPIDFTAMMWSIMKIVIFPVIAGLLFNHFLHGKFKGLDKAMPIISMAGIGLVIAIITAAGRDDLLSIGLLLILVVIIHNLTGYTLGYWLCRMLGMDEQSCRTIALEVGMQNGGLATGIALEMGKVATMGLAPAVFGPFMNISGSSLAAYWRDKSPEQKTEDSVPDEL